MTDPTQPGPTADRIAELEREIAGLEYSGRERNLTDYGFARLGQARAELARLRNEQPARRTRADIEADIDAWHRDIGRFNNASPEERKRYGALRRELAAAPLPEPPSPLPEPQDVREAYRRIRECNSWHDCQQCSDDEKLIAAYEARAAIAQSDAKPVAPSDKDYIACSAVVDSLPNASVAVIAGAVLSEFFNRRGPLYTAPHSPDASGLTDAQPVGCELSELAIAQAIEGPRNPVPPDCKWSLEDLRAKKWGMLPHREQKERLWQARSVIGLLSTTPPPHPDVSGLIEAAEIAEQVASGCVDAPITAAGLRDFSRLLRERATDRSAPRSDKGGAPGMPDGWTPGNSWR